MATKKILEFLDTLSAEHIDSDCRTVDWRELLGEDCEGWTSYDAITCGECGQVLVLDATGERRHDEVDESNCAGYLNSEGPMMNYFYPCNFKMSPECAARKLNGCLCVVQIGEETGLALTGGGMDLSWDIAAGYIDLGFLPPAWIRLPRFAGMTLTERARIIIEACKRTADYMGQRARSNTASLDQLVKDIRRESKNKKPAPKKSKKGKR